MRTEMVLIPEEKAFYIDRYEVTNAQYKKFMDATGHAAPVLWSDPRFLVNFAPDHPVQGVTWFDAQAYCKWAGKRLPTEAEWEKAAGGTDGRRYPWGNDEYNAVRGIWRANWSGPGDGFENTAPVGSFPAGVSPYGVHDMIGNVWAWVADWYDGGYYAVSPKNNPKGPSSGTGRVLRGGSWDQPRPRPSRRLPRQEQPRYQGQLFRVSVLSGYSVDSRVNTRFAPTNDKYCVNCRGEPCVISVNLSS